MISSFVLAVVLSAPPPKGSPEGRISLWIDDQIIQFRPDGEDLATFTLPDDPRLQRRGATLSADRKSVFYIDATPSIGGRAFKDKLVLAPLVGGADPFALDGFVVVRFLVSADGTRIYFTGAKGDGLDADDLNSARGFVLDVATKKVNPLALPDRHAFEAVSHDGAILLSTRVDTADKTYSRRTYLTRMDGGSPTEIFKENVFVAPFGFSPDGRRLLAKLIEYTDIKPLGNGRFTMTGKPDEFVVLDVVSKTWKAMAPPKDKGDVNILTWSPDGGRIAYLWNNCRVVDAPTPKRAGAPILPRFEYKVFVADADGGNPKEVYKVTGSSLRQFNWR